MKREVSDNEPSLAHTIYFDDLRQTRRRDMLVSGDWKLICQEGGAGHPERVQLFHLRDDPSEKHNRAEELPDIARKLESKLRAKLLRNEEVFQADRKPEATQLSDELLQRLADLGYL
jgi:arylsulfatase A-like enzyme